MKLKTTSLHFLHTYHDMEIRKRLNTEYAKSVLRCSVSEALVDCEDLFHKTSDHGKILVRLTDVQK